MSKIIQVIITPNDEVWQGRILGVGSDGVTYCFERDKWCPFLPNLADTEVQDVHEEMADNAITSHDWRPKELYPGLDEFRGYDESPDEERYMRFWWNVRQLVMELNEGWYPSGDPIQDYYCAYYSIELNAWDLGVTAEVKNNLLIFKNKATALKAIDILNTQGWSKGGVPRDDG